MLNIVELQQIWNGQFSESRVRSIIRDSYTLTYGQNKHIENIFIAQNRQIIYGLPSMRNPIISISQLYDKSF